MRINQSDMPRLLSAGNTIPSSPNGLMRLPQENMYEKGADQERERIAGEKKDFQADQDRQLAVFAKMVENPDAAPQIAQMYNFPYSPETDALVKNRMAAKRTLEAMNEAKTMGIQNPDAAQKYVQARLQNGNVDAALGAIQGMDTRAPMTRYQEEHLDYLKTKQPAGRRPLAMNKNITSIIDQAIDAQLGVVWNEDGDGLAEGSESPLDPQSKQAVLALAGEYYGQTGNPMLSVAQALEDISSMGDYEEGEESPYELDGSGWLWDDNARFRRIPGLQPLGPTSAAPAGDPTQAAADKLRAEMQADAQPAPAAPQPAPATAAPGKNYKFGHLFENPSGR